MRRDKPKKTKRGFGSTAEIPLLHPRRLGLLPLATSLLACQASPASLTAGADLTCVTEKNGRSYCFTHARERKPFYLPKEFDRTELRIGASICGINAEGVAHCMDRYGAPVAPRREPLAEALAEWMVVPEKERLAPPNEPVPATRICGRSQSDTMTCSALTGTRESQDTRVVPGPPLRGLALQHLDFCGISESADIYCFHAFHGSASPRGNPNAKRLFGGAYWLCAEYTTGDLECYSPQYWGDESGPPLARWKPPIRSKPVLSVVSAWLPEVCIMYDDQMLDCFAVARASDGTVHARPLENRPTHVKSVAGIRAAICAITADDQVVCWRADLDGSSNDPLAVPRPSR
jgi:hypothetical protein